MNWRLRADRLRVLPLSVVLAALEAVADRRDPAKWHTARGVLSVTGAKFVNWNQGLGGGGAIDLVMHVQQVGFGQALQWLEERFGNPSPVQPASNPATQGLALPPPSAGQSSPRRRGPGRRPGAGWGRSSPRRESGPAWAGGRSWPWWRCPG